MQKTDSKEVVEYFISKDILLSSDLIGFLSKINKEKIYASLLRKTNIDLLAIFSKDLLDNLDKNKDIDINWVGLDKVKADAEKNNFSEKYHDLADAFEMYKKNEISLNKNKNVNVLFSYDVVSSKRTVQDFVSYFNKRYEALEQILRNRKQLEGLTSIQRIKNKADREEVSIVGMVMEKHLTKNNNLILKVEDKTGNISVLINKNREELFEQSKEIVEDEVIGIKGVTGKDIVFANEVIFPDIPTKEAKKSLDEKYAVFVGDTHFGSRFFLKQEFNKFIKWINGELGDEKQREVIKRIKYLFVLGDLVDGVGIYPGQENDLEIQDIYEQYEGFVRFIEKVPKHINIIICAGNHDAMRISEPQPAIYSDFSKKLHEFENVVLVSNPALINIESSEEFSGFDVLMYHGYSFTYYGDNVETIRLAGGQKRPDLMMKLFLQKRHLAPTHTSTLYIPDVESDPLVIEKVPDFFVTGHIHRASVSSYNNTIMLNCSSWLAQTDYQEKVGLEPQPARAIIANLKSREIKVLKFSKDGS